MKIQVSFKPKTILVLLFANVVLSVFSILLLSGLDHIVHGDLYNYGLQFSLEWASKYWTYARLMAVLLLVSLLTIAMSIVLILEYMHSQNRKVVFLGELLSITGISLTCVSMILFISLDHIVHNDLYAYNLQFSNVWAMKYWTYAGFMMGFQSLAIIAAIMATILIVLSGHAIWRIDAIKPTCFLLLLTGTMGLVFSIQYGSQLLAFIGLGLVFWGAILLYVRSEEYSKTVLLNAMSISPLIGLSQTLQKLEWQYDAIYLPPRYLKDPESSRICIPRHKGIELPTPEEIKALEIGFGGDSFLLLTPPGNDLVKLSEKILNTRFSRVDLKYVQQLMPELFIEKLEVAEDLKMEIERDVICITVRSPILKAICEETRDSSVSPSLGNPVSSAIACILAKASGKLVKINRNEISQDGKTVALEYLMLEKQMQEI